MAPSNRSSKGRKRRLSVAAVLLATALAAVAMPPKPVPAAPEDRLAVLFIGNSLTYENDLPAILEALLRSAGVAATVESVTHPDYGLEDHWRSKGTRRAIERGGWDVVVMQQGPSATEGRPSLLEYSRRFGERIRAVGAKPALYMVWPARVRAFDFDGVSESYRLAAESVDGILLPVGDAWRAAWRRDPRLALYAADGFHPSTAGSYLAAAVIFERLTGRDPRGLPARLELRSKRLSALVLAPELAARLQEAAADVDAGPP